MFHFHFSDSQRILQGLKEINVEISETRNRLGRMEGMLERILTKLGSESKRSFIIDNNLNLPFDNIDEFFLFDEKLATDQQFKLDFVSFLKIFSPIFYYLNLLIHFHYES